MNASIFGEFFTDNKEAAFASLKSDLDFRRSPSMVAYPQDVGRRRYSDWILRFPFDWRGSSVRMAIGVQRSRSASPSRVFVYGFRVLSLGLLGYFAANRLYLRSLTTLPPEGADVDDSGVDN
jgi:hypothetical protein